METTMSDRRHFLATIGAAAAAIGLPALALAQAPVWPAGKPITYIVPFFPGSTADVVARIVTQKLGEALHQTFVIDNKAGVGGSIGTSVVAKAAPDGYTLVGGTSGTHAVNVSLYKNLPYDPVKDFEPVALIGSLPNVLVVGPNLGVNSVAELIALIKKDEKARTFGSAGSGTSPHLAGELFSQSIGVPLVHVPYKDQPGLMDVASGQLAFKFDQLSAVLSLQATGKIKVLAVTSAKRLAQLPNVPTMMEAGVPGLEIATWHAVFAPKGTPKPIIDRLSAEVVKAVNASDAKARLAELGMEVSGGSPAELAALMTREIPRWAEVVRKSGVTPG
jgi:tripartite-type tricarboxylate transporter receptor subunit TctC